MDAHLNAIIAFILHYRYLVILPVAILEGPIITVIAAFLAAQGYFNIFIVYIIVVIGDLAGDLMYYGIGRFGHTIAKSKIGQKLGVKDHHLDKVSSHYQEHSGKTLLFGKLTHSMGMVVLTTAGVARMPIWKFLWYNLIGTLPKSLLFTLLGYYVGYAFQKINSILDKAVYIIGIVIVLAIAGYFIHRYIKNNKKLRDEIK